jgi:hypothetical protein
MLPGCQANNLLHSSHNQEGGSSPSFKKIQLSVNNSLSNSSQVPYQEHLHPPITTYEIGNIIYTGRHRLREAK